MSAVFEIANNYVERVVELDPMAAAELGLPAHGLSDFSPAGVEKHAHLARTTLAELATVSDEGEPDRIARAVMTERLSTLLEGVEARDFEVDINILASPAQSMRTIFDLVDPSTETGLSSFTAMMADLPRALESWKSSLNQGLQAGHVAAKRQAAEVSKQCHAYVDSKFFSTQALELGVDGAIAQAAEAAWRELGDWLRDVYVPAARDEDAVGRERYVRAAKSFNAAVIDVDELFAWGWQELDRITIRLQELSEVLYPGKPFAELFELLENDPRYIIEGEESILAFLTDLTERTTAEMAGVHFDIPEEIRRCEVKLAGPGSASAPYYFPPSEDLVRPGSTWLPTMGNSTFHTWHLVSTWYHEAVPGHHLQFATTLIKREQLSRFQRTFGWTSGYGEGWALYAERLMEELGYLKDPGYEVGFLSAQALRAVRIVVDIGMHCGLTVPENQRFETAGLPITYEVAVDMLQRRALQPRESAESEAIRYLGWPGQAISYKLGERTIMRARAEAKKSPNFDLRTWHSRLLNLGPVGLDTLYVEMSRS